MKSLTIVFFLTATCVQAQLLSQPVGDTTGFAGPGKVSMGVYLDLYYAVNFNKPVGKDQPYFVSSARDREINVNLAYIDFAYSAQRLRARLVPGFGTYMNSNYVAEPVGLKNLVEASAGIKLFAKRNVWLDVGVFGSPFTNEGAISKDQLAYTRSLAPEYVPYYLAGAKLAIPLREKLNFYFYVLNGWQQIRDQNDQLSVATQLEYRPNEKWLYNWNTYFGDERSAGDVTVGKRWFNDFYAVYTSGRLTASSCVYVGLQQQVNSTSATWWQANMIVRYEFIDKLSVTARVEHFNDPREVQIVPVTGIKGFRTSAASIGFNYRLAEKVLIRIEDRAFFSNKDVFSRGGAPVNRSNTLTSNITIWF